MPPVAAARILRYIGKIERASNARPYNRTGKLRQPHDSPAGWGHPALRGNKKHYAVGAGYAPPAVLWLQQYTGSSVGTATMPPVAIIRALQYNGQTARNGLDPSLRPSRQDDVSGNSAPFGAILRCRTYPPHPARRRATFPPRGRLSQWGNKIKMCPLARTHLV